LKPTWGRVSRYGVFELAATLDHIGPMTRSAADCGAMLGVIAGSDPNDPTAVLDPVPNYLAGMTRGLRGLRVGVDQAWNTISVDGTTVAAVTAVLQVARDLGAEIRPITFPDVNEIIADWFPLCSVQTAVAHEATYPARKSEYGPALSSFIEPGRNLSGIDYQKIILRRANFRGRVETLFQDIDLLRVPAQGLASPTTARLAHVGEDIETLNALAAALGRTSPVLIG
jgi:amidase